MTRGGSQYGAGRPPVRARLEDVPHIDIRRWRRLGVLEPDTEGHCYARVPAGPPLSYDTTTEAVSIAVTVDGGRLAQRLAITWTQCHFGGARPWFVCPECAGRTARLFVPCTRFICRSCARLAYATQRDNARARQLRKIGFYPPHSPSPPTW
jgi:hypothetical protein